jgi:hypothetical protein
MSPLVVILSVFGLLVLTAGLWYASRSVSRGRHAPSWLARLVDEHRAVTGALLLLPPLVLLGLAAWALIAQLLS